MGADDDAGCAEHVWVLREVVPTKAGAEKVYRCGRCKAVSHQLSQAARRPRPPLGG